MLTLLYANLYGNAILILFLSYVGDVYMCAVCAGALTHVGTCLLHLTFRDIVSH